LYQKRLICIKQSSQQQQLIVEIMYFQKTYEVFYQNLDEFMRLTEKMKLKEINRQNFFTNKRIRYLGDTLSILFAAGTLALGYAI
jgi:hypothetical protein